MARLGSETAQAGGSSAAGMHAAQRLGRGGSSSPSGAGDGARSPAVRGAAARRRRRPIPAVRARNRMPFGLGASGGDDELI